MRNSVVLWALLAAVHAGELHAQAPAQLHVQVAGDACPDGAQLRDALAPVLERDVELVIDDQLSATTARRASVRDRGVSYTIEIDGARREVEDPRRNCVERARVASVFIALNMRAAPPPPQTGTPSTTSGAKPNSKAAAKPKREADDAADADADEDEADEAEPEEPHVPPPDRSGIGLVVFATGARSTEAERTAFGAGAGVYFATYSFRFELSAGVLAPIELALEPSGDIRGRVQLTRVPLALTASYLLSVGDFQLGPALGLVLDILHIQGEGDGVERPQSSLRVSVGGLLGAEAQLWLSDRVGLWARPQLQMFPMAYGLAVDPTGRLGETPRLWLSAQLGVEARFW